VFRAARTPGPSTGTEKPHYGYFRDVADVKEKAKDIAHALEHPVETAKALEHEAEEGRSARTPAIAVTGVTLVLFVIFALMLAITMTLYFAYK
jgi:hypothetical protein